MAQNIMKTGFRRLKTVCQQLCYGSKHYFNDVLIAPNIMQTAFLWLKKLCEQRFDGSKHYVNKV